MANLCLLDFRLALLDFLSFDFEDVLDLLLLLFLFLDSSSVLDESDEEVEVWKEAARVTNTILIQNGTFSTNDKRQLATTLSIL